jgi:hypothetical protein
MSKDVLAAHLFLHHQVLFFLHCHLLPIIHLINQQIYHHLNWNCLSEDLLAFSVKPLFE